MLAQGMLHDAHATPFSVNTTRVATGYQIPHFDPPFSMNAATGTSTAANHTMHGQSYGGFGDFNSGSGDFHSGFGDDINHGFGLGLSRGIKNGLEVGRNYEYGFSQPTVESEGDVATPFAAGLARLERPFGFGVTEPVSQDPLEADQMDVHQEEAAFNHFDFGFGPFAQK